MVDLVLVLVQVLGAACGSVDAALLLLLLLLCCLMLVSLWLV